MNNTNESIHSLSLQEALEWANAAIHNGKLDKAARRWDILLKAFPMQSQVLFGAITFYLKMDDIDNANRLYQVASKHFPNYPEIFFHGAQISEKEGKNELAEERLEAARQNYPNNLETWLQSSSLALTQTQYELAEAYNLEARRRFPDDPQPLQQHARIAMHQSDWQTALKRWETFRKRFPEHPAGYLLAAEAAEKAGNNKLARKLKLASEYGEEILAETESTDTSSFYNRPHRHATFNGLAELIWTKAIFNLRSETQRHYLSYLWWVIEPFLHMVVYFLVFGILLQRGGEGFTTFLLTGLIPWMWFSKAVSSSSNSILAGQGLMLQVGIPPVVFPLVHLLQASIKQIPVFLCLFTFVWLQGHAPSLHWLALIPVILVQMLLTIMLGSFLAAVIPFIRDLGQLVPTGLSFIMFLSGIFYSYEQIPAEWQLAFLINPMAFLMKCYREIFLNDTYPDFFMLGAWGIFAIIGCGLMLLAYQKLRYIFPRVVLA